MSKSLALSSLKDNWYLVAIIGGLLVAAVWGATREEVVVASGMLHLSAGEITGDTGGLGPRTSGSRWMAFTKNERVQADVESYEKELRTNRESPDTAANLFRLANLYYSNLQDYEKASLYYEDLLQNFPKFIGAGTVFPNLVICYERLGNLALERHTYKRMLDYYPSDSQEHLFASTRLGV